MLKISKILNINGTVVTAILGGEVKQIKCKDSADIISRFSPWLTEEQINKLNSK